MIKKGTSKIMLFGFVAVLLVGIPLALFAVKQQTENRQQAEKATTLSFSPDSTSDTPIQKNVGEDIELDITIDPGTNIVSFLKLEIQYDATKLATAEADTFVVNETAFPVTLEGPTYSEGKIDVTLSVGSDPTKALQVITQAAKITFKALAATDSAPTNVTYGTNTEILSIGGNDQASENVLLGVNPAVIAIGSATPTSSGQPSPTSGENPTTAPIPTSVQQPTTPPVVNPTSIGTTNQVPVCSSLNIDRETTGTVPYSVTFTVVGTDADGTISKVTFNYGDGPVDTVTEAGGIGSNSVSSQKAHTYVNPGTYQVSTILTDSNGGVSDANACKKTIIVLAPTTGVGGGNPVTTDIPVPTIAATGPGDVFLGVGAVTGLLTLLGGFLFFAL